MENTNVPLIQKCLNPNCANKSAFRGLCNGCYRAAMSAVKANKTTWSALEASGKCYPPTRMKTNATKWLLS